MARPPLTVTIVTLNEEKNIRRVIESVRWADEILVVDSGSTDRTLEIAHELGARSLHNPWTSYGVQKNFAQAQASYDWVLNLDADEVVDLELRTEIEDTLLDISEGRVIAHGFRLSRKTYYLGRWILHGGWYPNYLVRLSDRRYAKWTTPAIHESLLINGAVETLRHPLQHYSFENIQDQVLRNLNYSRLGFLELQKKGTTPSAARLVLKPIGKFIETFVLHRGFLDGLPGLIISINAAHSMFLKQAYLVEAEIKKNADLGHRL